MLSTGSNRWSLACAGALALLFCAQAARAQEATADAGRLLAVQQRHFRMNQELVIGGMFEPLDAFSKGLAPEGAFVWHLSDEWAWTVLRGGYAFRLDTGLKKQLERDFGVAPTAFEELNYYLSTSIDWSPVYGKFALRNAKLIHAEALVSLGGSFARFTSSFAAGPEIGAGIRVFATPRMSVRLDVKDALYRETTWKNVLFISLSLGINLGGAD